MNEELRMNNEELTKGNKAIREYVNKFISKAILVKYRLNRFIKELIALFTYSLIPFRKSYAFTLAEVLITLGIIGVVAALTMPTLISNAHKKGIVTHLKKTYSAISNAYNLAAVEYGTPDIWNLGERGDTEGRKKLADIFSKYLDVAERTTDDKLQLKDGALLSFYVDSPDCSYSAYDSCFGIHVSLPELKENNNFEFNVTKTKLIPKGNEDMVDYPYWYSFNAYKAGRCTTCNTAWVIKYENLDYLKCPDDLSWNGKTKCK